MRSNTLCVAYLLQHAGGVLHGVVVLLLQHVHMELVQEVVPDVVHPALVQLTHKGRNPHMCYELITHWCSSSTPTNCGFSSFQGVKLISSHNPFLNIYPIETSHVVPDVWTDRSSYMPPLSAVPPGRLFEVNASE